VVEASRFTTAPSETELEEAGARRLLAAVDELSERAAHLKRKREQLRASLPALSQTRADTYRLNSDALTLGRTGTTYQDPQTMAQLGEAEVTADEAMRGVQREIRQLDEEIGKIGRAS
jgi:prefoldin subunit 5